MIGRGTAISSNRQYRASASEVHLCPLTRQGFELVNAAFNVGLRISRKESQSSTMCKFSDDDVCSSENEELGPGGTCWPENTRSGTRVSIDL